MKKLLLRLTLICALITIAHNLSADSIKGEVLSSASSKEPIVGVVVQVDGTPLWGMSDVDGKFSIDNLSPGKYVLKFACLGYNDKTIEASAGQTALVVILDQTSLALNEAVVTAEQKGTEMNTSNSIGSQALTHLQASDLTNITSLLPGGKTVNPDLTTENQLSIRGGSETAGNAAFSTALEVDGMRLGNNASFKALKGVGTRSIAVDNIESVEVLSGVVSAEYGDMGSGIVKVNTRKGKTPWQVNMSANPRTYQVSLAKGFSVSPTGVLNVSGEWARATQKLVSPYTSYARRGITLNYSDLFKSVWRFEAGAAFNIGGMNSENDPDAQKGEYTRGRDNVYRAQAAITYLANKPGVTNLKLDVSASFNDCLSREHIYHTSASSMPAVHATEQGYFVASQLPKAYYSDFMDDSKELNVAANFKYEWYKRLAKGFSSNLKAGLQYKLSGNLGAGEYFMDPNDGSGDFDRAIYTNLASDGFRPRRYSDYPFMHNLSAYAEEKLVVPVGQTSLSLQLGVRLESLFIKGTRYKNTLGASPRFNFKWKFNDVVSLRGGCGTSQKLPSYYVLFPKPEYRDIKSKGETLASEPFVQNTYFTMPFQMEYNPDLKWQTNLNSELGVDVACKGFKMALVGFYNLTLNPYIYRNNYVPFSYEFDKGGAMLTDYTFLQTQTPSNGADVHRTGAELTIDFPQIKPLRTTFRLDASYTYSYYLDNALTYYYNNGWSSTVYPNRSYEYVGIYARGSSSTTANGRKTHALDANLTMITHIPAARLVITCRLEASLVKLSRNISEYKGREYAFNVTESSYSPTGGSIYDGESYTAIYPVKYLDTEGKIHDFTAVDATRPWFQNLIIRSANAYTYLQDGYAPYFSANLSVTKEIGNHVSLSFFANNFTASRRAVTSFATKVPVIFTPAFYYGLSLKIKI